MSQQSGRPRSIRRRAALATAAVVSALAIVPPAASAIAVSVATPTFSGSTPANNSRINISNPSFTFASSTTGATFYCSIDSGTASICTSPKQYTGLTEGPHVVAVYGTKSSYANSSTAQINFIVDTVAPVAPTVDQPTSPTNSTSASIAFAGGEPGGTFTCSVDGGSYSACTSPMAVSGLAHGSHSLAVKQTDVAGNVGAAATVTWTVDTVAPSAPTLWPWSVPGVAYNPASLAFSGETGAKFECTYNTGSDAALPCTSPVSFSGFFDGPYVIRVRQVDAAGNSSPFASRSFTIDKTAPSAATGFTFSTGAFNQGTVKVGFVLGESGGTVECKVDSGAWTACTGVDGTSGNMDLTGLAEGTHTLSVRQTDPAGNVGAVAVSPSWTVDFTPPGAPTAITGLASYSDVADSNGLPVVSTAYGSAGFGATLAEPISADGALSVSTRIECRIDSGSWTNCWASDGGTTFIGRTSISGMSVPKTLADGTHTVSLRQLDRAGNVGAAKTVSFVVYNGTPAAPDSFTGVPAGTTAARSATIGFTVPDTNGFDPRADYGEEVYCQLDGGTWKYCTSFSGTAGTFAVSGLSLGSHTLKVQYTLVGNESDIATVTWTVADSVDTTAPAKPGPFTGVPSSPTNSTGATIGFTLGEEGGTVECRLDSGSWGACTGVTGTNGSKSLSGLADGSHTVSVRQTDAAGNVSEVATTTAWTVDTIAPAAPTLTGPSGSTTATNAGLSFSGEAGASLDCSADGGVWRACASPVALSGLAAGAHSFSVRATDAAGNIGNAATASWVIITPIMAPTPLTAPAGTATVYHELTRWYIKTGLLFSTGGDTRSGARILSVQVAVNALGQPVSAKPSDSAAPPASASYLNGVVSWDDSGVVSRQSFARPVWVRAGNRAGKWSGWVKLTP